MPDVLAVLADRAVGGELPHPRGIEDRHSGPLLLVAIGFAYPVLAVDVGLVVGKQQVWIVIEQLVQQRTEEVAIAMRELPGAEAVDDFAEEGIGFVDGPGTIALGRVRLEPDRQ